MSGDGAPWLRCLAGKLRRLADRMDRQPEVDLYDGESLSATEYALVSMRLLAIEERLAYLEDAAGLAPGTLATLPLEWPRDSR